MLAAFLTAIANLWLTKLTAENNTAMEQRKWELTRLDEHTKSTSAAVAEFSRRIASGYQEGTWLLWKRINDPANFTKADSAKYDVAMKEILPAVLSSHVQIATLDPKLYSRFTPLVSDLGQTDAKIATLFTGHSVRTNLSEILAVHVHVTKSLEALGERIATAYIEEQPLDAELLAHYRDVQEGRRPPPRARPSPRTP